MFEDMAKQIHQAAHEKHKIAMFHFLVLKHAHELHSMDAVEFCRLVKVRDSFATEFRKMISLAKLIEEKGLSLC